MHIGNSQLFSYLVNIFGKTVGHGDGLHEEPVVLVGRLGEAHLGGFLGHSFSEINKLG